METSTALAQDLAGGLGHLSISHGTLRNYDLFHAMFGALNSYRNTSDNEADDLIGAICHEVPAAAWDNDSHPYWNTDEVVFLVNETLFDALNEIAPEAFYFGALEGDGSEIGFWPISEDNC